MQTITLTKIGDYLKKADPYNNPRTLKVVEIYTNPVTETYKLRAITFPQTFMIQWIFQGKGEEAKEEMESFIKELKDHDHIEGKVTEISGERR